MKPYPKYLDWLRYICAVLLCFYGVSKLTGHQLVVPSWVAQKPIGSLDGYTLTWYYFGYSHTYKYILGAIQVICAALLLFRKTALLAALMMVPMMINILLINIFYSITFGAERTATFILGCMLLFLWHQREALIETLWTSQPTESSPAQKRHWFARGLVLLFVIGEIVFGTVMGHPH
ncbi:hypothetical protein HNQ77_000081 [Silvibacterium bohemicum]|uniref:DoxX family protein n=1 Tax=Silvibacterium bohemicum TaxID=1577686 RepID=A0A841JLR7_9BACT|nr:hypothetical protein [Silvibacterium bohemicum]MBB6142143.1 hypothetical protein [Silvibacterium bohemicum]